MYWNNSFLNYKASALVRRYHCMTLILGVFDTTPLKTENIKSVTPETDEETNEDPADIVQPVFDEV